MRLLLDTHVVLWWHADSTRLRRIRRAISSAADVFVSSASAWEVAVKLALGRLDIPAPFAEAVADNGFIELPIDFRHAAAVGELPPLHADPFDRMLIAQARTERLTIVTHDAAFAAYDVPLLPL